MVNVSYINSEDVKLDGILEKETSIFYNPLIEMARVDNPKMDSKILGTKEIWVYTADKQQMPPYFYYKDTKGSVQFDLEIKIKPIKDLIIYNSGKRDSVPEDKLRTWYGLSDAKKSLQNWLFSKNSYFKTSTNYDVLVFMWNSINPNNVIDIETNVSSFND